MFNRLTAIAFGVSWSSWPDRTRGMRILASGPTRCPCPACSKTACTRSGSANGSSARTDGDTPPNYSSTAEHATACADSAQGFADRDANAREHATVTGGTFASDSDSVTHSHSGVACANNRSNAGQAALRYQR